MPTSVLPARQQNLNNPHLCPVHRSKRVAGCERCRACGQWLRRPRGRAELAPVRQKVQQLLDAHLTYKEIGEMAEVTGNAVHMLMQLKTPTGQPRRFVYADTAERILAIDVDDYPLKRRTRVEATGTRRLLETMALRRIGPVDVARVLHVHPMTVSTWRRTKTVPGFVAVAVKDFYQATLGKTGTASFQTVLAALADGALPDRMWTLDNVDDPDYHPLKPLAEPIGVRRRLRAMQRDGHGPAVLAARLGESLETVVEWTVNGPVPAYAEPLVAALFEGGGLGLAGSTGDDLEARRRAEQAGWHPSQAWYDIDIDDPRRASRVGGAPRRKTDCDPANVAAAVNGRLTRRELTGAELLATVRILAAQRMAAREIGARLSWCSPATAENTVNQFCANHGVRLNPDLRMQAQKALRRRAMPAV